MYRSSCVHRPIGLCLEMTLLLLWVSLPLARAGEKSTQVKFHTKDGVQLQGTFYPSPKGRDEPTVLLLHKIGGNSHQDGWDKLAETLQDKGYSVLSFDFRGHGKSTAIDNKFWAYPWNKNLKNYNPLKPKDTISFKDFPPVYYPYLVNDVAAARMFLDDRNEAEECNSHALILIGAEDGATLGLLWMSSEWFRHPATLIEAAVAGYPPLVRSLDPDVEGKDQLCAIWLNLYPTLGGRRINPNGLKLVGREKKVPMAFLYGAKDDNAERAAQTYLGVLKGPEKMALPCTTSQKVPETRLTGSALLHPDLGMPAWIADKYLPFVRDTNVPNKWGRHDLDHTSYVWVLNSLRLVAKPERGKTLEPIPVEHFARFGLFP